MKTPLFTGLLNRSALTGRTLIILAVAAVVASGGSAAVLASSSPAGTVYRGCLSHFGGRLYHVTADPGQQLRCRSHDQEIIWNQAGPQGPQGPAGTKGDTGATGPAGPPGLTGLYWVSGTFGLAPGTTLTEEKSCNPGDEVYGGGTYIDNPDGSELITEDAPNSDLAGWDGGATYAGTATVVKTLHVYALCGPKAP